MWPFKPKPVPTYIPYKDRRQEEFVVRLANGSEQVIKAARIVFPVSGALELDEQVYDFGPDQYRKFGHFAPGAWHSAIRNDIE